ncbi:DUF1642 domain-containing protein [Enterococcus faecium]|uniref:DUF1642 domain-containing protein n=1 Tax=Enterococcus faecium TaxID=1352 RepID=UPI000CF32ACF|nr:DUF1642 domain-containing protein [Enterococcus faecium]EME3547195.1 DUF1642 domain-containing protein [Enterococcus faecium]PQG46359.1 hypothetical protein CUS80_05510 [Enterococcus faecium]
MDIQELIEKWESETGAPVFETRGVTERVSNDMYTFGYNIAQKEILEDLKQLDESQKKIIPKYAHKFIQEGIDSGEDYFTIIICADSFANAKPQDEFSKWLRENSGLFIRALLNGYEIKKEPLYEVIIGDLYLIKKFNDRNDFCFDTSCSLCAWEKSAYQLTEAEIKAIDERFWVFAVPVEEVVEG